MPPKDTGKGKKEKKESTSFRSATRAQVASIGKPAKRGAKEDGTDAAHILSHEVTKAAQKDKKGRPEAIETVARVLDGTPENLRIKTVSGNRGTGRGQDRGLDREIIAAMNGDGKVSQLAGERAARAIDAVSGHVGESSEIDHAVERLGQLKIATGTVGRPTLVSTVAKERMDGKKGTEKD